MCIQICIHESAKPCQKLQVPQRANQDLRAHSPPAHLQYTCYTYSKSYEQSEVLCSWRINKQVPKRANRDSRTRSMRTYIQYTHREKERISEREDKMFPVFSHMYTYIYVYIRM